MVGSFWWVVCSSFLDLGRLSLLLLTLVGIHALIPAASQGSLLCVPFLEHFPLLTMMERTGIRARRLPNCLVLLIDRSPTVLAHCFSWCLIDMPKVPWLHGIIFLLTLCHMCGQLACGSCKSVIRNCCLPVVSSAMLLRSFCGTSGLSLLTLVINFMKDNPIWLHGWIGLRSHQVARWSLVALWLLWF